MFTHIQPQQALFLYCHRPPYFVAAITGHDLANAGALYEYLSGDPAIAQPGAAVLAGFEAPPYGQLGDGVKSPTLDTLKRFLNSEQLLLMMSEYFPLLKHTTRAPAVLLPEGRLWPLVEAAFASSLMHYAARCGKCVPFCFH